ncbi:MAG: sugar ABC transporter permease [Actinomycetota bacterium]
MTSTLDESPPPTGSLVRPSGRKRPRGGGLWGYSFPAAFWYALFTVGPLFAMFYLSTQSWPGLLSDQEWVGLDNFRRMWDDPLFWRAARNTGKQLIVAIPVMIPLSFMLGYYLTLKPRGHRLLRVLFFTPGLISITAKSMVFFAMFAPNGGVNGVLDAVGLEELTRSWTANPSTALWTIVAVDLWSGIGWTAVLFAARLASVPDEVYEAASLDGAGHMRMMYSVAYPMAKDFVGVMTMLQFLWTMFNSAAIVLLLTDGGPAGRSTTLSYYVYERAFIAQQVGYSQAIGVVLLVLGIVGLVVIRRLIRQDF